MIIKTHWLVKLVTIYFIALIFRMFGLFESVYFAYDQARDVYIAREIYKQQDIKLVGPPVSGASNLFHGIAFWYLLIPVDVMANGDPIKMAIFFRAINALGVFLVFAATRKMFDRKSALTAALIYAVSFEQAQYAMYVGNPVLGNLALVILFLGVLWKSMPLTLGAAAMAMQFNLMYVYTFFLSGVLIILFKLKNVKQGMVVAFLGVGSFILAEIKYGFRGLKSAVLVWHQGYNNMQMGQSRWSLYWDKYLLMFKDNLGITNDWLIVGLTIWLFIKARKEKSFRLLLVWIFAWVFLMMLGGHSTYYTNAGLGVGVIILGAVILSRQKKYIWLFGLSWVLVVNANKIINQAPKSLIPGLAAQEMMKLADEQRVINFMYETAAGQKFTIRQTGIPYKVQTLWAYLFNNFGQKKYGYLPIWENGNTLGFPGVLPVPMTGTTCLRFRLVEPKRGLPQKLIDDDLKEENYFSNVIETKWFGEFLVEKRWAKDKNCF